MKDFWQKLPKNFSVLAPMEDVTDTVFRRIVLECGKPDVFFTEFTSCEGMLSKGRDDVMMRLEKTETETPLIAQIWGVTPSAYFKVAKKISKMGFDGIDLNMGCPVRKITKQGACSALIQNPKLAGEIISAVKEGAPKMPISVKTRIGFKKIETDSWISFLLNQGIDALTVHGRIAVEMSTKPNNWEQIKRAVQLRDEIAPQTIIIANGDIKSVEDGIQRCKETGCDGYMIGRGVFDNPWVFDSSVDPESISKEQRLDLLKKHVELFDMHWGERKNFQIMKKFVKIYVKGFEGANELRIKMMDTKSAQDLIECIG